MKQEDIRKLIYSRIDSLPALPGVIPRLLSQLEDSNSGADDIARTISSDPSLTANILRVANSAYYGFSGQIASLEHAIALLGFNMIKSLALSTGVIKIFRADHAGFSEHELWVHSLTVATSMNEISRRFDKSVSGEEHIFIIGLLHDIGKILFAQFIGDRYQEVLERYYKGDENLHDIERQLLGIDHGEAGGLLLKRWLFPDVIYLPVHYHHQKEVPPEVDPLMLSLLSLSDKIAISLGNGDKRPSPDECKTEIETLSIDTEIIETTANMLKESEERINAFCHSLIV
ncbi:MAG: HDOD domain-containing protein [Nitrospirae bacterium]|nr:HDOD domain-containing protein [Nitrospirota bacterium]